MAIVHVRQVDKQTNTTTLTVPVSGCAQGNTIIVWISWSGTSTLTGVTDSKGNTYTINVQIRNLVSSTNSAAIVSAYLTNALVSGDTLTMAGVTDSHVMQAHEFSGIATAPAVDKTVSASSASAGTTVNSGATAALTGATDLYAAAIQTGTGPLVDTTTGLTNIGDDFNQYEGRYKILAANTAVSYQGTIPSGTWAAAVATYQAAGATPTRRQSVAASIAPSIAPSIQGR